MPPRDTDSAVDDAEVDDSVETEIATGDDVAESDRPPLSFQEAFKAARDQHSKEHAAAAEASTETAEETDGKPPARKGKEAAPAPAVTAKPDTTTQTGLISDAEFTALQEKHPDDPAALRKALEGVFTKKTQALADERRSTERLQQYAEIIDAYEENPEGTVLALAKQLGLQITAPGETAETTTTEETEDTVDKVMAEFKEKLGPDLDYLAESLAPAIKGLVERLTATTVEKATQPLKKQTETLLSQAATEQTATVMQAFGEKHPDWQEHEEAMLALSQKLSPKEMTEPEYLDHLYTLVTAPGAAKAREKTIEKEVAEQVKKAVARMNKGAEETETKTDATPERHVRAQRPENPTFREAYDAAKRGEVWN